MDQEKKLLFFIQMLEKNNWIMKLGSDREAWTEFPRRIFIFFGNSKIFQLKVINLFTIF